jgi:hypothetical protein
VTCIAAAALAVGSLDAVVAQAEKVHYLILAKNHGFSNHFETAVEAAGGVVEFKLAAIGVAAARSQDPDFAAKASAIDGLEAVVPDLVLETVDPATAVVAALADVPQRSSSAEDLSYLQWSLDAVQAPEAWEAASLAGNPGARGAGVRVAVLDGEIDLAHPDILPNLNLELSRCFVDDETLQYRPGGAIPIAHGSAAKDRFFRASPRESATGERPAPGWPLADC